MEDLWSSQVLFYSLSEQYTNFVQLKVSLDSPIDRQTLQREDAIDADDAGENQNQQPVAQGLGDDQGEHRVTSPDRRGRRPR